MLLQRELYTSDSLWCNIQSRNITSPFRQHRFPAPPCHPVHIPVHPMRAKAHFGEKECGVAPMPEVEQHRLPSPPGGHTPSSDIFANPSKIAAKMQFATGPHSFSGRKVHDGAFSSFANCRSRLAIPDSIVEYMGEGHLRLQRFATSGAFRLTRRDIFAISRSI